MRLLEGGAEAFISLFFFGSLQQFFVGYFSLFFIHLGRAVLVVFCFLFLLPHLTHSCSMGALVDRFICLSVHLRPFYPYFSLCFVFLICSLLLLFSSGII